MLPLRRLASEEVEKIERLAPGLLLFLKKLKRIELQDDMLGRSACYKRIDRPDGVELSTAEKTTRFRLVSRVLEVPPASQDVKRQGVSHTEVMLAFPVAEGGEADASTDRHVYAYLPVRSYGFRFLVQADFILSSNREAILADRPWNQWLRDQVAPLFLQAVESFKQDQGGLRTTFLAYVPERKRAAPFDDTRGQIIDGLRKAACILSAPGEWAVPAATVLDSFGLRPLIGDDDVRRLLRRDYVDDSFLAARSLLQSLGVLIFGLPELVRCLGTTEWLKGKPDEWFASLFARLSTLELEGCLEQLKALPIIPLEDGTLASIKDGEVFLPLNRKTSYGFESHIPLVRNSVITSGGAETAAAAKKFLRTLGVRKHDPAEVIAQYILPLYASDDKTTNWAAMDYGFRIGSVAYIKDHLKDYQNAGHQMSRLSEGLYIKYLDPGDDRWFHRPGFLYLSKAYGNSNSLEIVLKGIPDVRFVHPVYLEWSLERIARRWKRSVDSDAVRRQRRQEAKGWRDFFSLLGVLKTVRVEREPNATEPKQADSPELENVFKSGGRKRLRRTFALLDANWSYYREYLETPVVRVERGRSITYDRKWTHFAELLADSNWVPTTTGSFACPADVYLDTPATRELLANDVAYLGTEVKDERLIDEVGINRESSVEAVLKRLGHLSEQQSSDVATIQKLYRFLDEHYDDDQEAIDSAFADEPLFCLPGEPLRYLPRSLVFWQDVGPIFGDSRGCLSKHWPDLKRFFTHKLEVSLRPSPEDYAALLTELGDENSLTPKKEKIIWAVYRELDRCLGEGADRITDQSWWKEFINSQVFWTDKGEFWANDDNLFVNDTGELYDLFRGQPGIAFLKLPANQHPHISRFLKAARIALLSEAVVVEPVVTNQLHDHPGLAARCRQVTPFIIRYLFYREQDFFRQWQGAGTVTGLEKLEVKVCDDLHVVARLEGVQVPVRRRFASRFPTIFISRGEEGDLDGLAAEVAHMLRGPLGLEMFIAAALSRVDARAVERLMQAQGIPQLPGDEEEDFTGIAGTHEGFGSDEEPDDAMDTADLAEERAGGGALVEKGGGEQEEGSEDLGSDAIPAVSGADMGPDLSRARAEASRHPEGRTDYRSLPPPELGEEYGEEEGGLASRVGPGRPATSDSPPSSPRSRDGEPVMTPAVWSPACSPEHANRKMSEVVPSVIEAGAAATRVAAVGDGHPSAEPEELEDLRLSPNAAPIGRWGERYAVLCLKEELSARHPAAEVVQDASGVRFTSDGVGLAEVRWLNWQKDEGVGCDIEVVKGTGTEFVEVKSTSDGSRSSFAVTAAQWQLARQQGAAYRILRVFHAGTPAARAESYHDPYRLWQEGRLTARLLQIVI
jgi:hypothetical protein